MSITIALTLENYGISQFTNQNFNSIFRLGDKCYGVDEDGIHYLCADDDNGIDVDAYVVTRLVDFETQTRLRNVYVGYEAESDLTLEITADEGIPFEYILPANKKGQVSQGARVRVQHKQMGRYFAFKISNNNGDDFSIDSLEVTPIEQQRKPR